MKRRPQNNVLGARVKVEGCEVGGWLALDGQFLSSRHFGVKLLSDFLRDLALDCEYVIQVTIVFFGPDVRVRARVDQLGIQMDSGPVPAHASFQYCEIREARLRSLAYSSCRDIA